MDNLKNQGRRLTNVESWSPPPHVTYHPLRVSRSVSHLSIPSLDNSRFSRALSTDCRTLSDAGGFVSLDDDNDYPLEDSLVAMDSAVRSLCSCHQKPSEVSCPRRSRSFLGYLPDVEEEEIVPFPLDLQGSSAVPPNESYCYDYSRPQTNFEFIYSEPSGLETSRGMSYFSTTADENVHRPRLEEEILMSSAFSRCTLGQTRHHDERRVLLSAPQKFRHINRKSSDIYNSEISFRNLPDNGLQSPGFEVQFRNGRGAFVPSIIRPNQPTSNNPSEVPSSSSLSVSSDETEHQGEHSQLKVGLYKTELCRSWEETGFCRYGAKCQFAHGNDDLRPVPRHPKYKTELCRSFTDTGLCSYGKRCRFVHSSTTLLQARSRSSDVEMKSSRRLSIFQQLCGAGEKPPRQP